MCIGRLSCPALNQEAGVGDSICTVGFDLRLDVVLLHGLGEDLQVGEGVLEDVVLGRLHHEFLPGVFEFLDPLYEREDGEVHALNVQGAHLGLKLGNNGYSLLCGHPKTAAGGGADHYVAFLLDLGEGFFPDLQIGS